MGTLTNLDWPTRMVDVIVSIACGQTDIVLMSLSGKQVNGTERTSARRPCAAFSSEVIWLNRKTSLVKVEANTDAV